MYGPQQSFVGKQPIIGGAMYPCSNPELVQPCRNLEV